MTLGQVEFDGRVRGAINQLIVADGFAPSCAKLAAALGVAESAIIESQQRLADSRGLVLHPGTNKIWVAHPFSLAPTGFWVRTRSGSWWGNCAWCSLGIIAMLGQDGSVRTHLGAENETVEIFVRDGRIEPAYLLAHFAVPAARWWDNVVYTCSTKLLFDSDVAIDSWCERHDIRRGETLPISLLWELAQAWFGDYLSPDWKRHSLAEARDILAKLGLTGAFWDPGTTD